VGRKTQKGDVTKTPGIQDYIHGLITEDQLNEQEILHIFGVNETQFKNKLKPVIKNILQLFYYLNTGQILKDEHNFEKLNRVLKSEGIQEIWDNNELTLGAILKLLTLMMEHLHGNKFFLKSSVINLPYVFNSKQHFNLNYDSEERCFQPINKCHIEINPFSSVRFEFQWKLIVEQILYFVVSDSFEGLSADVSLQNPPIYLFHQIILHNLTQNQIDIQQGSVIGHFKIQTLQNKFTYMPRAMKETLFDNFTNNTSGLEKCNIRFKLSEKIANLLNLKNNKLQNDQIANLHNNTQRQIFITKLVKQANINPASLPRGKNDKLLLNFNDLLGKLNAVLIGQYLQKLTLSISKSDMELIQNSDLQLVKIKERIEKNDTHLNDKFCLIQNILFTRGFR
jgi:hypothetical protein